MSLVRLPNPDWVMCGKIFLILHILLYPASNGHNSFYDRDTDSIGGLAHPPPVSVELFWLAWIFDLLAVLFALSLSWFFTWGILVYSVVSQAYSHPRIRLKKYPWISLFFVSVFQGGWIVFMVRTQLLGGVAELRALDFEMMGLATLYLITGYPLSQIYQHSSDAERGDLTLSRWLGVQKTWFWCQCIACVSFVLTGLWVQQEFGIPALLWQLGLYLIMGIWVSRCVQYTPSDQLWSHALVMRIQKISVSLTSLFWLGLMGWGSSFLRSHAFF
jgi:1,4-dihydroxy-2-naphthoate octaprenyltransferase